MWIWFSQSYFDLEKYILMTTLAQISYVIRMQWLWQPFVQVFTMLKKIRRLFNNSFHFIKLKKLQCDYKIKTVWLYYKKQGFSLNI